MLNNTNGGKGKWVTRSCAARHAFICEKGKVPRIIIPGKVPHFPSMRSNDN